MRLRIYPKGDQRPLLFEKVTNVDLHIHQHDWSITFNHIDHINKNKSCVATSHFSSGNSSGLTFLYENSEDHQSFSENVQINRG